MTSFEGREYTGGRESHSALAWWRELCAKVEAKCNPWIGPLMTEACHTVPCVHYVGFRGDEFARAKRIWGGPVFIHRRWDKRAQRDIGPADTVIFATGDDTKPLARFTGNDLDEPNV